MKLLDGICEQETNIQHFKYSASHTVSHSQRFSLWVKAPVSVREEVIGIWFWVCFGAKSFEDFLFWNVALQWILWQILSLMITFPVVRLLICLYDCTNTATTRTLQHLPPPLKTLFYAHRLKQDSEMCHSDLRHRLGVCITSTAEPFWFLVWISFTRRVDGNFYRNLPH